MATRKKAEHEAPPPAIGRPPIPEEDRAKVRALRLTDAEWAKFQLLGGTGWLRERIAKARNVPE